MEGGRRHDSWFVTSKFAHRARTCVPRDRPRNLREQSQFMHGIPMRAANWTVGLGKHPETFTPVCAPPPDTQPIEPGKFEGRVDDVDAASGALMAQVWESPSGRAFLVPIDRSDVIDGDDARPRPGDAITVWSWRERAADDTEIERVRAKVEPREVAPEHERRLDAALDALREEFERGDAESSS